MGKIIKKNTDHFRLSFKFALVGGRFYVLQYVYLKFM